VDRPTAAQPGALNASSAVSSRRSTITEIIRREGIEPLDLDF
jgi:hypothetical protein